MTEPRRYRVLAITDDETTCGFCGKTDLQRTVAFEDVETGETLFAGTTCAATVRLIVLDEGEARPRTAREILTLAQRATRERALSDALDSLTWATIGALTHLQGPDTDRASQPIQIDSYTSAESARGLKVPSVAWTAYNARARENMIIVLARDWARAVDAVRRPGTLAKREKDLARCSALLAERLTKLPRTEPA